MATTIDDLIDKVQTLVEAINANSVQLDNDRKARKKEQETERKERERERRRKWSVSETADHDYREARQSAFEKAKDRTANFSNFLNKKRRWAATSTGRNIRTNGRTMSMVGDMLGKKSGALGKFGGAISKAGGLLTKFAGPIGIAIQALELLGQAAKATAEAYAKAQDIQNQKNTALTQRNIGLAKNYAEGLIDEYKTVATKGLNKLNTENALAIEKQGIENQKIIAATQTKIGAVIGNINDTAWSALSSMTDYTASIQKYDIKAAKERAKTERANAREENAYFGRSESRKMAAEQINLDADAAIARLNADAQDYIREHPYATAGAGVFGGGPDAQFRSDNSKSVTVGRKTESGTEDSANQYMELNSKTAMSRNMLNGVPIIGGISENANATWDIAERANMEKKITNATNELAARTAKTEMSNDIRNQFIESSHSIEDSVADASATVKEAAIDTQVTITKAYQEMARTVEQTALEHQNISYKSGLAKGIVDPQQLRSYSLAMGYIAADVSKKFGLNMQEIYDMQNKAFAETGRTKIVGDIDMQKLAAMGRYLGDNGLSAEIAGSMEIFNTGVSASVDTMYEMARSVNKIGLDGRKYTREAVKNLKLAQKYDFKNGVNGMLKMSKWAQEVRFNMDSLATILEKIQTGGLEGNITNAAKMQVLGGRFAMAADPLAMMYEGFNSPEELAERYNSALSGMGIFNRATGKVDFSMSEQMIMREFANITGQDLADVRNQASYHLKKDKVKGSISNNAGLTPEQEQFLINQSYWDQNEKKWKVTGINGKAMDVANINSDNIGNVQANDYESKVEQAIERTMDWQSKIMGLQENQRDLLALAITGDNTLYSEMGERYQKGSDEFKKRFDEYVSTTESLSHEATKSFSTLLNENVTAQDIANQALDKINGNAEAIKAQLSVLMGKMITSDDTNMLESIKNLAIQSAKAKGFSGARLKLSDGTILDPKVLMDYGIGWMSGRKFMYNTNKVSGMGIEGKMTLHRNEEQLQELSNYLTHSDGVMSANGTPILSAASSITPINDGGVQLAKSDPADHAIFAKAGGPFDKLFDDIIGEVDTIHDYIQNRNEINPNQPSNETLASNITQITPIVENPTTIAPRNVESSHEVLAPRTVTPSDWGGSSSNQGGQLSFNQPLKIEIGGKIELGMNGQSLDITKEIANNPQFIRQLTQLISEGISRNMNGGKTAYMGGQLVGGLGFAGS